MIGSGYRKVIESFGRAFPGIVVEHLAESWASVWLGRVRQGRRATTASFDLALVPPDRALTEGGPEGMWAPIKPLLFRPDVLDDTAWRDGLHTRFKDAGGTLCFGWEYQVIHAYAINTDVVQEGGDQDRQRPAGPEVEEKDPFPRRPHRLWTPLRRERR